MEQGIEAFPFTGHNVFHVAVICLLYSGAACATVNGRSSAAAVRCLLDAGHVFKCSLRVCVAERSWIHSPSTGFRAWRGWAEELGIPPSFFATHLNMCRCLFGLCFAALPGG